MSDIGLPLCCPNCHERRQLPHILLGAETRFVCCSVLAALVAHAPDAIGILERWPWPERSAMCGTPSETTAPGPRRA